jgi:hypothetical protein
MLANEMSVRYAKSFTTFTTFENLVNSVREELSDMDHTERGLVYVETYVYI